MKWPLLAMSVVLSLSGCQNRQPVMNPFMGPTVVPPPATGAAAPGAAPYYQGSPPPGSPPSVYTAPGGLPPAGAYNYQAPPAGSPLRTTPGTIPGTTPTYTPPAGSYRAAPSGSNTRVAPPATGAFAARTEDSGVRVASSDVVYLDQSIPVSPVSANQVRALGNEPSIQIPTDSKPDRLKMQPSGGIRRVSYDAPANAGTVARPSARPLFAPPPLPYQNANTPVINSRRPQRQVVRPTAGRPTPAYPPAARAPIAQRPVAQRPVSYSAATGTSRRTTAAEPRRFTEPPAVVEISDLPLAGPRRPVVNSPRQFTSPPAVSRSVTSRSSATSSANSGTRISSYVASAPIQVGKSQPTPAASPRAAKPSVVAATPHAQPSPRYGHAPDYRWLTGKLEYSRARRQWKLRYIPIDGNTDSYGGSVLIANEEPLQAFQAGDYVSLQGSIVKSANESRSFAPKYQVSRAKAISK